MKFEYPRPYLVALAPNGARLQKYDHPHLPISAQDFAEQAQAWVDLGVHVVHLHVRDDAGQHALDVAKYQESIQAIRDAVGDQLIIQVTTEACGIFTPEVQINCITELKPEACSIALKELLPQPEHLDTFSKFLKTCQKQKTAVQYILYHPIELQLLYQLWQDKVIPQKHPQILIVLGKKSAQKTATPQELLPFMHLMQGFENFAPDWMVCAFGRYELACLTTAVSLEGSVRVGFENNTLLADQSLLANNAASVAQLNDTLGRLGFEASSLEAARTRFLNLE